MSDDKAWLDAEQQQLATLAEIERGLERHAAALRGDVNVSDVIDWICGRPTFFAAEIDVLTEPADAAAGADRMLPFLQRPWRDHASVLEVGPIDYRPWRGDHFPTPAMTFESPPCVGHSRPPAAVDDLPGQVKPNVYGSLTAKMPAVGGGGGGSGSGGTIRLCAACLNPVGAGGCGCQSGFATGGLVGLPGLTGGCYASIAVSGESIFEFGETDDAENSADTILVEGIGHPPMSAVQALAMWLGEATDKGWSLPAGDVVTTAGRVVDADGALQDLVNAIERFRCYGKVGR